jgi:hypothetical protein
MVTAAHGLLRRERITTAQACGPLAPGAGTQMAAVAVLRVAGARAERISRFVERIAPGQSVGACLRGAVALVETAYEQLLHRGM